MGVCVVFKGEAPGTGEIGHLAVYFFFLIQILSTHKKVAAFVYSQ